MIKYIKKGLFFCLRAFQRGLASKGGENLSDTDSSWFSKLWVRKIEPSKESHSRMLSDKEIIYALHTHNVRPGDMPEYLAN